MRLGLRLAQRRAARRLTRLALEQLEQRCVLAAFTYLDPGGPANLVEEVPVNIVFVGYDEDVINLGDFAGWLPTSHDPVIDSRRDADINEEVGLHYTYDYEVTFTDAAFEDAFFAELSQLAVPQAGPDSISFYQGLYNQQALRSVDIDQNYLIDAPSVEKWLAANPPAGVDTAQNTMFFVNWWGRPDFKFHVYTDNHDSDPDTGFAWGNFDYYWRLSFGGTTQDDEETGLGELGTHRIWFHDLSAGPDAITGNWDVDHVDLDGDGSTDSWLPPIWDYLERFPDWIGNDLGVLARFVGIDAVFTASPVFPPYLTFPRMPESVNLDINVYEGWHQANASEIVVQPQIVLDEVNELFRVPMTVDLQDLQFEGQALQSFNSWRRGVPYYVGLGNTTSSANLVYQEAAHLDERLDGGGEYEAVSAIYALDDRELGGLLTSGLAFPNYYDGTQSFVVAFVAPGFSQFFLATETLIHEYGHHFGLNHPHDTYDSEFDVSFGGFDVQFMWTGTEVNSVMSYNFLNNDFSQFDLDNFNRFWAAGYIKSSNAIVASILASPNAAAAAASLALADTEVGLAQSALAAHDYLATFDHARLAYEHVLAGADLAGVEVIGTDVGQAIPPYSHGQSGTPIHAERDRSQATLDLVGAARFGSAMFSLADDHTQPVESRSNPKSSRSIARQDPAPNWPPPSEPAPPAASKGQDDDLIFVKKNEVEPVTLELDDELLSPFE